MLRRLLWIGLGSLFALALFRASAGSPPRKSEIVPPTVDPPGVRVEHELVTASIVTEPVTRRAAAAAAAPPSGDPVPRPHTRPDGFLSKARRAIVGDGRHRPEPFPRVRR
jgi:hypothetical protein